MEQQGWVKFYREWMENPYIYKDGDHMAIWLHLLLNATHKEIKAQFGTEIITLKLGQLLTSYREIEEKLKINRRKVEKVFAMFKKGTLIGTVTDMRKTLVTIELWNTSQTEQGDSKRDTVGTVEGQCRDTNQETENEKEKSSKREKDKEKEINKNEKNERISIHSRQQSADSRQQKDDLSFRLEKDLDRWLEEDDGIDDWDKMSIYYKNQRSPQQDSFTGNNEMNGFALTNPIQPKKKEININSPQPPSCEANHTEGVHVITAKPCMESAQGVVWNQPQKSNDCATNHADGWRLTADRCSQSELFDEFWKAYPKKIGKGYAFECFKKIRVSRSLLDTMLEAIAKQKKSDMWKRDKGQYIPNPSTWLNQKRWEDDLDGETEEKPRLRLGTYL